MLLPEVLWQVTGLCAGLPASRGSCRLLRLTDKAASAVQQELFTLTVCLVCPCRFKNNPLVEGPPYIRWGHLLPDLTRDLARGM